MDDLIKRAKELDELVPKQWHPSTQPPAHARGMRG